MSFANLDLFRKITPFSTNQVSDKKLSGFMSFIDPLITKRFAKKVYLQRLKGNRDGSNKLFYTYDTPIANISGVKRVIIDDCDAITGWTAGSGGGTIAVEAVKKRQGSNALRIPKSGTSNTISSFEKSITEISLRKKEQTIFFYVDDKTALDKLSKNDGDLQIRFYDGTDYFQFDFGSDILNHGWHELKCNLESPSFQSGTPSIDAIDKIYLHYTTNLQSDTLTDDDIVMDYWYSEGHAIDGNDVQVFFSTNDTNNEIIFGNPQPVTSVDAIGGRIEVVTAPTNSTADRGVFATYYIAPPDLNYDLIILSATYLLAHYASFIIGGKAPNYTEIREAFMRRDTTGQHENSWLDQSIDVMNQAVGFDGLGVGFRNVVAKIPDMPPSKLGEINQSDLNNNLSDHRGRY